MEAEDLCYPVSRSSLASLQPDIVGFDGGWVGTALEGLQPASSGQEVNSNSLVTSTELPSALEGAGEVGALLR